MSKRIQNTPPIESYGVEPAHDLGLLLLMIALINIRNVFPNAELIEDE